MTNTIHAAFTALASADVGARRITGLIVPFGEVGHAALNGEPADLVIEAGGLSWDNPNNVKLVVDHGGDRPVFAGRARDLIQTPDGIVATFSVAKTQAGDDLLVEASEGLRTGLSVEADIPSPLDIRDGVVYVTAANPAPLSKVAAVEYPAFSAAQVQSVAAQRKVNAMTTTTVATAAEVPDSDLAAAVTALGDVVGTLNAALGASQSGVTPEAAAEPAAAAGRPAPARNMTAATSVTREAFPYGHPGAEGLSLFGDVVNAKNNGVAAARVEKAHAMLAESRTRPVGRQLIPVDVDPSELTAVERFTQALGLTAANEPTVRSTLVIPNVYDFDHYAAQLRFPRVIADQIPGASIDAPNPQVVPVFTSSFADGGSGQPVVASTEGVNPAQAEAAVGTATVTPVWYTGLYDIARQALDAAGPATDALCMGALLESYAQVTEAAAVTSVLANGTAGTDVTSNADTVDVEPRSALKSIRTQLGAFYAGRGAPADAVLYASDVYQAALGADGTDGRALYSFLSDRFQIVNAPAASDAVAATHLSVYGVPGQLAFRLTATKFVIVKWSDMIRYESPTYEFRLEEVVAPASVRLAIGGYFACRTLQPLGARYFGQL